jgi:hypothetical protein
MLERQTLERQTDRQAPRRTLVYISSNFFKSFLECTCTAVALALARLMNLGLGWIGAIARSKTEEGMI